MILMAKTSLGSFTTEKERTNLKTYDALIIYQFGLHIYIYLLSLIDKIEFRIENGCVGKSSLDLHDRRCFDKSIIFIRKFMSGKNLLNTLLASRHLKHQLYAWLY